MGSGLKRVAQQCGGLTVKIGGKSCFHPPPVPGLTPAQARIAGKLERDLIGMVIHEGKEPFVRFASPLKIHGLGKFTPDRKDLLAVDADRPGNGDFRKFIAEAKKEWATICVWFVQNDILAAALSRYGFGKEIELSGDGEVLEGMRWDRKVEFQKK